MDMPQPPTAHYRLLRSPRLPETAAQLQASFRRREMVIVAGNCQCLYSGRASSSLGPGERVVIVKGDGSVQVHRPTGYEPVNWQPPGCMLSVSLDGALRIRAYRPKQNETLDITFESVMFMVSLRPVDRAEFNLYVSEEQMRDALVLDPSLLEAGLRLLEFERKVEPGFIDFYGKDVDGRLVVVELKRNLAGKDAVLQLKRYVDAVSVSTGVHVRGIVAAPGLRSGTQEALAALGLEFRKLTPRRCAEVLERRKTRRISEYLDPSF
ncbi:MAG: endonuclease NucS [Candidatus Bathyarchaeia archaeon]